MAEIQLKTNSAIECLRQIFNQYRHNVNFDALITGDLLDRCQSNAADVLIELANQNDLRAEKHTELTEIAKTYNHSSGIR